MEQLNQMQRDIRAIAVSKIAEFVRMMDMAVDTSDLERIPFTQRLPVGMYVFTYLEAADKKTGEAMERSCQVMVYSNAVKAYQEMLEDLPALFEDNEAHGEYLSDDLLSEMEKQCYKTFFHGGMLPPYAPKDIISILKFYAQTETIPEFYKFETVDRRLDLRRFAQYIVDNSLDGIAEKEFLDTLWKDDIIRQFFCNRKSYFFRTLDVELLKIQHPDVYADPKGSSSDRQPLEDLDLDELRELDPKKEAELRTAVFQKSRDADGRFQCAVCGAKKESKVFFHVDYIIPLNEGGKTAADNLQILCRKCYEEKKTHDDELYYSALDLAIALSGFQLDCRSEAALMEQIWEQERPFLREQYRTDKRQLFLDILYWKHYVYDKETIDKEFPVVKKDVLESGGRLSEDEYTTGFSDFNRFFKSTRIRILYGPGKNYVRVKRRILLEHYHFKRMSPALRDQIEKCLQFYHLAAYLRGGVRCKLEDTKSDDMIIFKLEDR